MMYGGDNVLRLHAFVILSVVMICTIGAVTSVYAGGSGSATGDLVWAGDRYISAQITTDPPILHDNVQNVTMSIQVIDADAGDGGGGGGGGGVPIHDVEYTLEIKDDSDVLFEADVYSGADTSVIIFVHDDTSDLVGNITNSNAWIAEPHSPLVAMAPVFLKGGLYDVTITIRSIEGVVVDEPVQFVISFSMGEFIPFSITYDDVVHDLVFATYLDKIDEFNFNTQQKSVTATMPFEWDAQYIESIPFVHAEYYIPKTVLLFENHDILLAVNDMPYFGTVDRSGDDQIVVHFLISSSKLLDMLEQISDDEDKMTFEIKSGKERHKEKQDASLEAGDTLSILSSQEDWKFYVTLSPAGKIHPEQDVLLSIEFRDPVTGIVIPLVTYDVNVLLDGVSVYSESARQTPDGKDTIRLNFDNMGAAIVLISNVNGYGTTGEFAFQVSDALDGQSTRGVFDGHNDNHNNNDVSSNDVPIHDESSMTHTVDMAFGSFSLGCERDDSCFEPFEIVIQRGDIVEWINQDVQAHTVASGTTRGGIDGMFESPVVAEGGKYSHKFGDTGIFEYFCTLHPWMTGSITVNDAVVVLLPDWIKNNAKWWSEGLIDDVAFSRSLEYLIQENIIVLPVFDTIVDSDASYDSDDEIVIPDWIKNNAKWWSEGLIDDDAFVGAIKWMMENGIIVI